MDEGVIRQVIVKRMNYEVTEMVSRGAILVAFLAVAVSVPRKVQPVACPAFPIMRGGQTTVNQLLVSARTGIVDKCIHFFGGWRQADQIECDPPDQSPAVNWGRGSEAFAFQC